MKNSKFVHRVISVLLCMVMICCGTLNALASTDTIKEGSTQNLSEYFEMNGKTYMLETTVTSDKVIATVYNDKHEIESQAVNNDAGLSLDGNLIGKNNFQTYATPNYKLVSTDTGSLKPASWTAAALIAAIAALNPGAGAAAIAAVADAIIIDAGTSYTYKLETWTASDDTFFYQ